MSAIQLDGVYVPASHAVQVGGDWYDTFKLPDGRILFSIGDVCGHGVGAAIVMSRVRQAILTASVDNSDPSKILELANTVLLMQDSTIVTALCGFVDTETMAFTYATAGHPAPILAGPGAASSLWNYGPPLGASRTASYRNFVVSGDPNSIFVLYTDGLLEYRRDIVEGERRLLAIVNQAIEAKPLAPARYIFDRVFERFSPSDDVAILTIAFKSGG